MSRTRGRARGAVIAVLLAGASCCRSLPEPESPGGRLYAERCATACHGAYQPSTMKFEMWKLMVDRMQGEMVRRGVPPLNGDEKEVVLEYLRRHAG